MIVRRAGLLAVVGFALGAPGAAAAPAVPPVGPPSTTLSTGFNDVLLDARPDPAAWLLRMRGHGARDVRILASWGDAAPVRPPSPEAATDRAWSGYRFAAMDRDVRRAAVAGLRPTLMVYGAPAWAEGPERPEDAPLGTWRPNGRAYGAFMQAVAARYDGTTPDPERPGAVLPQVRAFQAWNEPNLAVYLSPQWRGRRAASPGIYRELLDGAYEGVKRAQPGALVLTAGTSPFGETRPGTPRMRPARFWRGLLCLNRRLQRTCGSTTQADVVAHHPYPTGGPPSQPAFNRDDISVADVAKLARLVRGARRIGSLGPRTPPVWVTEFGVRSNPPAPTGYAVHSLPAQARYVAESQWRLWRLGVSRIYLFSIVDEPPSTRATNGHAIYAPDGRRKPSALAAEFATYAARAAGRLRVWVRPPVSARMALEVRRGGRWRRAKRFTAVRDRPRTIVVGARGVSAVRATGGGRRSYAWRVR